MTWETEWEMWLSSAPGLPVGYYLQTVEEEALIKNNNTCKDFLIEAMKYHLLPLDQRLLIKNPRTKPRTPVSLPKVSPSPVGASSQGCVPGKWPCIAGSKSFLIRGCLASWLHLPPKRWSLPVLFESAGTSLFQGLPVLRIQGNLQSHQVVLRITPSPLLLLWSEFYFFWKQRNVCVALDLVISRP